MSGFSVVISEVRPGAAAGMLRALAQYGPLDVSGYACDGLEAAQMAVRLNPHVLLLHAELPGLTGPEVCRIVSQAAPEVACALLLQAADPDAVHEAMLAGARAVITPDLKARELYDLLANLAKVRDARQAPEYKQATDASEAPLGLAVAGPRGGSGCTTVVVNLALVLARRHRDRVVLVDATPMAARAADMLGLRPQGTLWELAEIGDRLDDATLSPFLVRHSSGLRVLAGGSVASPRWVELFSVDFVAQLLGVLRRRFRFVLLDLPCLVWDVPAYAMRRSERVLIVTEARTVTDARDAAALVKSVRQLGVPPGSLQLVANRVSKGDQVAPEELADVCGLPSAFAVPEDARAVAEATRAMATVVEQAPASPLSRALGDLAQILDTRAAA